jgi:hypothetical protein
MTPLQIAGALHFARRRQQRIAAEALAIGTLATRGELRDVKRRLDELSR